VERPKVKEADFHGKEAHLAHREEEACAILCTMTLDNLDISGNGSRYPVGISPIIDPETGEKVRIDFIQKVKALAEKGEEKTVFTQEEFFNDAS
jgi:hypothetical protein